MAGLSDEQKARIRAEEEARAQALAEERYRQQVREALAAEQQAALEARYREQVRAEIGTGAPTSGAPGVPTAVAAVVAPTAPRPAPSAGAGRAVGLWAGAAVLAAGAITLGVVGFTGGGSEAAVESGGGAEFGPPDIVAAGEGALAPVAPARWDPAALGFEGFEVRPDGSVVKVPATGVRSLAALAASAREVRTTRAVVPESPLPTFAPGAAPPAAPPAAASGHVAAVMRFVPPDAWIVVGVDGPSLRGSRLLTRVFADLVAESHGEGAIAQLDAATGVNIPGDLAAFFLVATPASRKDSDEILLGLCGAFDERSLARFFFQNDKAPRWVEGPPVTWVEGDQLGAAIGDGCTVVASKSTFRAALAARTGNGALLSPRIGPTLRRISAAPSGFALFDLAGPPARDLGRLLPDLASATVLGVGVDARDGLSVDATLAVGDPGAAARLVAALDRARVEAPAFVVLALSKVKASADGATVRVTLRATEQEALALYTALKESDP